MKQAQGDAGAICCWKGLLAPHEQVWNWRFYCSTVYLVQVALGPKQCRTVGYGTMIGRYILEIRRWLPDLQVEFKTLTLHPLRAPRSHPPFLQKSSIQGPKSFKPSPLRNLGADLSRKFIQYFLREGNSSTCRVLKGFVGVVFRFVAALYWFCRVVRALYEAVRALWICWCDCKVGFIIGSCGLAFCFLEIHQASKFPSCTRLRFFSVWVPWLKPDNRKDGTLITTALLRGYWVTSAF